MLLSPPSIDAPSARNSSAGPSAADSVSGRVAPMSTAPTPASRPAITQMPNDTRPVGTPASRAASGFSAVARLARPSGLRRRKTVTASAHSGATMRISSWPGPSTSVPIVRCQSNGVGKALPVRSPPRGMSRLKPNSACASAMVATSIVRRGPRERGRMTSDSVSPPIAAAPTNASTSASQYGQPLLMTRIGINSAGSAPISPAARLSTRDVR